MLTTKMEINKKYPEFLNRNIPRKYTQFMFKEISTYNNRILDKSIAL